MLVNTFLFKTNVYSSRVTCYVGNSVHVVCSCIFHLLPRSRHLALLYLEIGAGSERGVDDVLASRPVSKSCPALQKFTNSP